MLLLFAVFLQSIHLKDLSCWRRWTSATTLSQVSKIYTAVCKKCRVLIYHHIQISSALWEGFSGKTCFRKNEMWIKMKKMQQFEHYSLSSKRWSRGESEKILLCVRACVRACMYSRCVSVFLCAWLCASAGFSVFPVYLYPSTQYYIFVFHPFFNSLHQTQKACCQV